MPDASCYGDYRALGARLDEIEKARLEREAKADERARLRDEKIDEQFAALNEKMDSFSADRQTIVGVVWAVRVIFGGLAVIFGWFATNGVPEWIKHRL